MSRQFHRIVRIFASKAGILVCLLVVIVYVWSRPSDHKSEKELEQERIKQHAARTHIDVRGWFDSPTTGCEGNFFGYGEEFLRLRFARLDPKSTVFHIPCDGVIPPYRFQYGREGTPLQSWHDTMATYPKSIVPLHQLNKRTTIALMRIEAHNLYHTMCEWYNIFIISYNLVFNPSGVDILFMDDRPPGHMDETWKTLFNNVYNYSTVKSNIIFKHLIWNIIGYESPMNQHFLMNLPYLREFREFFLGSFGVRETRTLNCDRLSVTVFLRRDYMTHPERLNMTGGLVHRKFKNEEEIINEVKSVFHGAHLNIVILEDVSMRQQLEIITQTDVLIGMHGAGMTHILFLPRHAVVFEMFPKYWGFFIHFKAMARWRKVKYYGWHNKDEKNEFPEFYTYIPQQVVRNYSQYMKHYLCGSEQP